MRIGPLLREAWQLTWRNKRLLWIALLGLLAGLAVVPLALFGPRWLRDPESTGAALVLALPLALLGAIIDTLLVAGVRRARAGQSGPRPWQVLRARWKSAFGILIIAELTGVLSALARDVPGWMIELGIARPVVIVSVVLLALPYAALEITRCAWLAFGLRHAVIEDVDLVPALIRAWRFLRGRIALALKLHVTSALVMLASFAFFFVPLAIASLVTLTTDASFHISTVAIVVAMLTVFPALAVAGVLVSALYTVSFLDERAIR